MGCSAACSVHSKPESCKSHHPAYLAGLPRSGRSHSAHLGKQRNLCKAERDRGTRFRRCQGEVWHAMDNPSREGKNVHAGDAYFSCSESEEIGLLGPICLQSERRCRPGISFLLYFGFIIHCPDLIIRPPPGFECHDFPDQ